MLKLTVQAETDQAIYLIDDDGNPIAKLQVTSQKGNLIGVGIKAPKSVQILRNAPHLIPPDKAKEYDDCLRG